MPENFSIFYCSLSVFILLYSQKSKERKKERNCSFKKKISYQQIYSLSTVCKRFQIVFFNLNVLRQKQQQENRREKKRIKKATNTLIPYTFLLNKYYKHVMHHQLSVASYKMCLRAVWFQSKRVNSQNPLTDLNEFWI